MDKQVLSAALAGVLILCSLGFAFDSSGLRPTDQAETVILDKKFNWAERSNASQTGGGGGSQTTTSHGTVYSVRIILCKRQVWVPVPENVYSAVGIKDSVVAHYGRGRLTGACYPIDVMPNR